MGFLRNLLLAIAVVAIAEAGVATTWGPWYAAIPFLALPHCSAIAARALGTRGRWRLAALFVGLVPWSAAIAQAAFVLAFGWAAAAAEVVGAELSLEAWPGPALFLVLAPYVLAEFLAIDARARLASPAPKTRADIRRLHGRLFLSTLVPISFLAALAAVVGMHRPMRVLIEEVALLNGFFTAALLALFALALPALLTRAWKTTPIPPGWQRAVLESTAERAGFHCRDLRLWHTSNLMSNAAVVGFLPRHRVVLFSDALLLELDPAELAAVFAHEVGHAMRRHVWILGAWAIGALMLVDAAIRYAAFEDMAVELAALFAVMTAGYFAFGFLSRRFELDADLASVDTTGDVDAMIRALEQVSGAHARERTGWRHFSVADRVKFLRAYAADSGVGRRLRRTLRLWAIAGAVVFAGAGVLEVVSLAQSYGADRVVVELRLGRYDDAEGRAASLELDDRLRGAVDAGRGLADEAPLEVLLAAAWQGLEGGDARRAMGLLDLVFLREGEVPAGVAEVLLRHLEDDRIGAVEALVGVSNPRWRAGLGALVGGNVFLMRDSPPRSPTADTLWS